MKRRDNQTVTFLSLGGALSGALVLAVGVGGIGSGIERSRGTGLQGLAWRQGESVACDAAPRAALIAAVQASAGTEYDVSPESSIGNVRNRALNPAQHALVEFLEDGVRVAAKGTSEEAAPLTVALRLARLGREGALVPATPARAPVSKGNRVEYRRGAELTEWYVNGPLGLEQGFTLRAGPGGRRSPRSGTRSCWGA